MKELLDGLPPWVAIASAPAGLAAVIAAFVLVWNAGARAGARRLAPPTSSQRMKDRFLFAAALLAGATVYAAFVIGSYEGLTAFAREVIGWDDWKQNLVPVTLDGGGAAFGFLAFRAVARRQSPYRCYAVVWSSAGASAFFNFIQGGQGHRWEAGLYLAFLSLAGMVLFHTFLDQFRVGAELEERTYPKFGLRWATYLPNTLCAALAWINHPPAGDTTPTVSAAVAHLETVRAAKRAARNGRRAEAATYAPGWTRLWPWARNAHLVAALNAVRNEQAATDRNATEALNARLAEIDAEHSLRVEKLEALHRAEVARLQAELDAVAARNRRAVAPTRTATHRAATVRATPVAPPSTDRNEPVATAPVVDPGDNETAVQMLVAAHNDPAYAWSQNKVRNVLAVGWPRAKELVELVAAHHARTATTEPPLRDDETTATDTREKVNAS
jgi:hypothetical protein